MSDCHWRRLVKKYWGRPKYWGMVSNTDEHMGYSQLLGHVPGLIHTKVNTYADCYIAYVLCKCQFGLNVAHFSMKRWNMT